MSRLRGHLDALYPPDQAADTHERLLALLERFTAAHPHLLAPRETLFDETDVVLITYADQVTQPDRRPLESLHEFLVSHVAGTISGLHLLPMYPATSDDGFAVADYLSVDPRVGTWRDVLRLGNDFRLMLDAVFNHVSASNPWFRRWRAGDPAFRDFFVTVPDGVDLTRVTRPRATPLLTPVETVDGVRKVWTTFSPDQVDLNYANPEVLLAVTEVLLAYIGYGAQILRLDAVAFLWKRLETACVHLPETHEIIRLWRTIVETVAPGALLITETNVPHAENMSYFGDGTDEAHLVYQFPLAPLVLSAYHLADSTTLQEWAAQLTTPSPQTTFFNFLGSHDGIGCRPAEGILTRSEINQLVDLSKSHGGGVSYKQNPDGSLSPYELNTVYFDALTEGRSSEPRATQVRRFLSAQSVLLALAGVPGIYVQALLGSRNWKEGVELTGRLRSINREKFDRDRLEAELADPSTLRHDIFTRFTERIRQRTAEPSFHPNGAQRIVPSRPGLFCLERTAPDGSSAVLAIHSLSGRDQEVTFEPARPTRNARPTEGITVAGTLVDICSGAVHRTDPAGRLTLTVPAYGVCWLRESRR